MRLTHRAYALAVIALVLGAGLLMGSGPLQ